MGYSAGIIVAGGKMMVNNYAPALLKDVTPRMFARVPVVAGTVIKSNHPAWCLGHLSIYPRNIFEMLGLDTTPVQNPPNYPDLFKDGTECKDDAEGTIYPAMDEVVTRFTNAYKALFTAIEAQSDESLARPNPREGRSRELFPTIGVLAGFLSGAHIAMHLGQMSTWRRCMGLGSAM